MVVTTSSYSTRIKPYTEVNRLLLFFLLVVLTGSGITFLLVRSSAESVFRSYVFSGDAEKAKVYASILGDYYSEERGWAGAQAFLASLPRLLFSMLDWSIHGDKGAAPASTYPMTAIGALMSDRIVLADPSGVIVADTAGKLLGTVHPARHLSNGAPVTASFARVGTVLVGSMVDSSLTDVGERFLASIVRSLSWSMMASAVIAFLLGTVFAIRVTRPIASLTAAVEKVASGDLSTAVTVAGGDEIAELATSFNVMTEELKRLEDAKRRIIADSAHELRTPVTLIQGAVEAMIDGVYPLDVSTLESVHEETVRLSRLIDTLRELELIESGRLALSLEDVDPADVARRAVGLFGGAAKDKGIDLEFEARARPEIRIRADYLRIGEVVYNLLSNAIAYTPPGGKVRVRIETGASEGAVVIAIEDSGPGIPVDERASIFERFYRVDKSRAAWTGGRGLGLAIASEIVKAHNGSIEVGDSDLGGVSFMVSIPFAQGTAGSG